MEIHRVGLCLTAATLMMMFDVATTSKDAMININNNKWLHLVHDKFLSITLHPRHLLFSEKFGAESTNMAKGLAPAFIRIGGPESDLLQFTNTAGQDEKITVSEKQWNRLNKFVTDCNLDLVVCLNPLQRMNGVWDSRSTLELISMSDKNGYNLTWQLGFETQKLRNLEEGVSGAELGRDIVRLRKILDSFPRYKGSDIIGPDITSMKDPADITFIKDYLIESGYALNAITWHPQFAESNAAEEDVLQSLSMVYSGLDSLLYGKDHIPKSLQYITEKPMWIAESQSQCYDGEFSDAMIWVRRLGTAARLGFYVFMHHIQESAFDHPTPDFWVSLLYKNLVGRAVLDTRMLSGNRSTLQVFSHCTAVDEIPIHPIIAEGYAYERGAVTIYGSNSLNEPVKISLMSLVKNEKVHIYILTEGNGGAGKPRTTLLNGQELLLSPTGDLPVILPKVRTTNRNMVYSIPPKSVFFIVLPEAKVRTCTTYPGTTLDESNSIKRLKQGKSSDAKDVLEETLARSEDNLLKSNELNTKETYVTFNSTGVKPIKGRNSGGSKDQKNSIGKGKSTSSRNKANRYRNRNDEQANEQNAPKEDIAANNVKYVTFSDSSWLPNISQTNLSKGTTEDIIQSLNKTFSGYIDRANSSLKILHDETDERREKYTVLANAIFGKRNASSSEVKSIASDLGKDGLTKNRRKRYIANENTYVPYLNRKPIFSKSEYLTYPIAIMPLSKQNGVNKNKIDKMLLNRVETDGLNFKTTQENINQDTFPTGDIYVEAEGKGFEFVDEGRVDGRDMFQKDLDSFLDGVSREDGYNPGVFFENIKLKPTIVTNDALKNAGELSEAEFLIMGGTEENKDKFPEKDSIDFKVVTEKCCNDTHDKEINKLFSQHILTHYRNTNGNLQQELSDYDDNIQGDVKKKEKAILSSFLNKQASSKHYNTDKEDSNSDDIFPSWETSRTVLDEYKIPKYINGLKASGRIRRAVDDEIPKNSDESVEMASLVSYETDKIYLDKSEEDKLTQLLKNITEDGEKLLYVLDREQKELEQDESNTAVNLTVENRGLNITEQNVFNSSTEGEASIAFTTNIPESNKVSLGYTTRYEEDNDNPSKNNDFLPSPKSIEKNNAIEKMSLRTEMKKTDSNLNFEKNITEDLYITSVNDSVLLNRTSNSSDQRVQYRQRIPKSMTFDPTQETDNMFESEESRVNETSILDDLQMQTEISNSTQSSSNDDDFTKTELPAGRSFNKGRSILINSEDTEDSTDLKPTTNLVDDKDEDEDECTTTTRSDSSSTTTEWDTSTDKSSKNDSIPEIIITKLNDSKQIESVTEIIHEGHGTTENQIVEITTKNNLFKPSSALQNKLKSPLLASPGKIISNNLILSKKNETLKPLQTLQNRTSRPKRRNEQIELLRTRLTAYREHLNELTKKRIRNKREIDTHYYSKNHIFKKDNPYKFERIFPNPSTSNRQGRRIGETKSDQSDSEFEMLFEPKTIKQVIKLIAKEERKEPGNNGFLRNRQLNEFEVSAKNDLNTTPERSTTTKVHDYPSRQSSNNIQQHAYYNGNKNEKNIVKNTSPVYKYTMLQQQEKTNARGYDSINDSNQIKQFNNKYFSQTVDTDSVEKELDKSDFNRVSFRRLRRSVRPETRKKISPRAARYIAFTQKIPSQNNLKFETVKPNKKNRKTSLHKRSLDAFETDQYKNSVHHWLSTKEEPRKKLDTIRIPLFQYSNGIDNEISKYTDESNESGLSKIKKVTNLYKKPESLNNKHMDVTEFEQKQKHVNNIQNLNNISKKDNVSKIVNKEEKNVEDLSNRTIVDLFQDALSFIFNQMKSLFLNQS